MHYLPTAYALFALDANSQKRYITAYIAEQAQNKEGETYMRTLLLTVLLVASLHAKAFIAHEWGTFTSFQDGQGTALLGLHRGDQPLPDFVYLRNPLFPGEQTQSVIGCFVTSYSCDYRPDTSASLSHSANLINQRMETPVIYFYSQQEVSAQVTVDFPQGIITEWYPRADHFVPEVGRVYGIDGGSMTWNVDISTQALPIPAVAENSIWNPSRQVDANYLRVGNETERLIFYRGVGHFETPFRATRNNNNSFTLNNLEGSAPTDLIPAVLYIRVQDGQGYVQSLGSLQSQIEFTVPDASQNLDMDTYLEEATNQLVVQLVAAGLYEKEALAMANTWRQAYFLTPGERFLYILPSTWTESLLPMKITPAPEELNRALVGRVEVMNSVRFEEAYNLIRQLAVSNTPSTLINLDFSGFEEQVLRMVEQEVDSRETDFQIQSQISTFCRAMIAKHYL